MARANSPPMGHSFANMEGPTLGVAVLPNNRLWTGQNGNTYVNVFDLISGAQVGTVGLNDPGDQATSMTYLPASNTVLVVDGPNHHVSERDLSGTTLHEYGPPFITMLGGTTKGPEGHVYAIDSNQHVLQWQADGTYIGSTLISAQFGG